MASVGDSDFLSGGIPIAGSRELLQAKKKGLKDPSPSSGWVHSGL
jgi:hypothetical protein